MLRLAWKTLATATLLGLLYIVGHAASGVTGPETSYQRAQAAYGEQLFSESITLLSNALNDLGSDARGELAGKILSLRGAAYRSIRDLKLAIKDFRLVHSFDPENPELTTTLAHSLISNQQPEAALEITRNFSAADPANMRVQELSGEAEQMIYQGLIRSLRQELQVELGPRALDAAIEAIRPWFYRDDNDPKAVLSRKTFDEVLEMSSPRAYASRRFDAPLGAIRHTVALAMDYYRAAFELQGMPTAAYQGFSYALEQGGRFDDLQALAEIFMLRFKHWRSVEAAIDLAELHLENHRYRATVDASDRYLPPGTWRQRGESTAIRHLLNAKSAALLQLGASKELSLLARETRQMQFDGGMNLRPEFLFIQLRDREAAGDDRMTSNFITRLRRALPNRPNSEDLKAKLLEVLQRQFAHAMRYQQSDKTFDWIFRTWLAIDSDRPAVHLARAQHLGEIGDYARMFNSAKRAMDLDSHDEDSLRAYTLAADVFYHQSSRGAAEILLRILALDLLVPDDLPTDHLLMPIAELALEQGYFAIAQACALQATQKFNWARWPRHILIKSHLALGQAAQAIQAASALLAFFPGDAEGIRLSQTAKKMADKPTTDLLFRLLLIGEHDAEMASDLLGYAAKHQDAKLEADFAHSLLKMEPGNLRARDRIAMLQYAQGDLAGARETLDGIVSATLLGDHRDAAFALSRKFLLTIVARADTDLEERFTNLLAHCASYPGLATDLSADLRTLRMPDLAARLLEPILLEDRHAKARSGQLFLLAAQLAIEDGRNFAAIAHLKAARSFADGLDGGHRITILHLRMGDSLSALNELGSGPATDFLSACLAARLGRVKTARQWSQRRLATNPLDFNTRLLAAILDPSNETSPLIRPTIDRSAMQVLQLLIMLSAGGFENDAMVIAAALLRSSPGNALGLYLYAEAQANSGLEDRALATLSQLIVRRPQFTSAHYRVLRLLPKVASPSRPDLRLLATPDHQSQATLPATNFRTLLAIIPRSIIKTMADDWIRRARELDLGMAEVSFLLNMNLVDKALELSASLAIAAGETNPELWRNYLQVATTILTELQQPESLLQAGRRAQVLINQGIEIDDAVNFLLLLDLQIFGSLSDRLNASRENLLLGWIKTHLEAAQHGTPSDPEHLARSLKTLATLKGREKALEQVDKLLTADPSLLEIWILRARWLAEDGRLAEGLAGLRGILDFVPDNPAQLTAAELAAGRSNIDLRPIRSAVARLPEALHDSPAGRLSRGLLALRAAEYALADSLLANCAQREDGSPIYYRALANLSLARPDVARALFLELATDYPDSSLSVNALHFAAQLSN